MKLLWMSLFIVVSLVADGVDNIEKINKFLTDKFLKTYPNMNINSLTITRYSKKPKEFERYKLKDIYISKGNLQREKGSLSAIFTLDTKKRKLFYHYKLDATVDVLIANQHIQKGRTLTDELVDFVPIKFTNFYQKPITAYYLNRYRAKTSLIPGKVLTTRHVSKVTVIKRGDILTATLKDGGVVVSFSAQAMKDAHIGDIIKIKRNHKSFFKAKIVSSTHAKVIE